MDSKAYILNLKFGMWENQLWFAGADSPQGEAAWQSALDGLNGVGGSCTGSNEFFLKAVEFLEERGFYRIQK